MVQRLITIFQMIKSFLFRKFITVSTKAYDKAGYSQLTSVLHPRPSQSRRWRLQIRFPTHRYFVHVLFHSCVLYVLPISFTLTIGGAE